MYESNSGDIVEVCADSQAILESIKAEPGVLLSCASRLVVWVLSYACKQCILELTDGWLLDSHYFWRNGVRVYTYVSSVLNNMSKVNGGSRAWYTSK